MAGDDLFAAADERLRERLRELGWVPSPTAHGRYWHRPGGGVAVVESEAFAALERLETREGKERTNG